MMRQVLREFPMGHEIRILPAESVEMSDLHGRMTLFGTDMDMRGRTTC